MRHYLSCPASRGSHRHVLLYSQQERCQQHRTYNGRRTPQEGEGGKETEEGRHREGREEGEKGTGEKGEKGKRDEAEDREDREEGKEGKEREGEGEGEEGEEDEAGEEGTGQGEGETGEEGEESQGEGEGEVQLVLAVWRRLTFGKHQQLPALAVQPREAVRLEPRLEVPASAQTHPIEQRPPVQHGAP